MSNLRNRIDQIVFDAICSRSLIYNACWEDPAVDRQALALGPDDTLVVITSAGCNVLDYALLGPARIHAVDANPRQNALLELKIAAIKQLGFDDFFRIFGDGYHPGFSTLYRTQLRSTLSPFARSWWDRHQGWFTSRRGSFYFHGLTGLVAGGVRGYFRLHARLGKAMQALVHAGDLTSQRTIYDEKVAPLLWNRVVRWAISRPIVMSLLGVPHAQRELVEAQHPRGLAGFIREAVEYVFRQLPLSSNYFWRVYLTGRYDRRCC